MIVDSRHGLPDLGQVDVCIVGGGAAGIALAVELARTPMNIVLLDKVDCFQCEDCAAYRVVAGPK